MYGGRIVARGLALADILVPWLVLCLDGYPTSSSRKEMWRAEFGAGYSWEESVGDVAILCSARGALLLLLCGRAHPGTAVLLRCALLASVLVLAVKAGMFALWGHPWPETVVLFALLGGASEAAVAGFLLGGDGSPQPQQSLNGVGAGVGVRYEVLQDPSRAKGEGEGEGAEEEKERTRGTRDGRDEDIRGILLGEGEGAGRRKPALASFRRMLRLAKPEFGILLLGTLALFMSSGAQMVVPALFGRLISGISSGHDDHAAERAQLDRTVLLLLVVFAVLNAFAFVRVWLFNLAGERLVARFRTRVFDSLAYQDVAFFDSVQSSELVNRLASDTSSIQSALTVNVSMALRWIVQSVAGLAILFVLSPTLSGIMLAIIPFVAIGAVVFGKFVRKISKSYQKALAEAGMVAGEVLGNIRTVRSFANEDKEIERYGRRVGRSFDFGRKRALAFGTFASGVGMVAFLAITLVLWYGGRLVINGDMQSGELLSFLLYTIFIAFALGGLASLYGTLMSAIGASERMFQLLDREPGIDCRPGRKEIPREDLRGDVTFEGVSFAYPSRPDRPVLKRVSLGVESGQTVALVGQSGAGKSTVIALLERFYDPQEGRICIDGRPLPSLPQEWLHRRMALVSQEPALFACSIKDNILYGCSPDTGMDLVVAAAKQANCHEFIAKFPEGYDTLVGERGVQLSGGQKQRVAIARAILLQPKVLLLDEATSALDAESEYLVTKALDELMKHCTTIVIAHRLSTVRGAAQVLVLSEGKIVERGTHEDLLKLDGIYRQLVAKQLTGGKLQVENGGASSNNSGCEAFDEKKDSARRD